MKVLAKSNDDLYIVQIHKNEISNILGIETQSKDAVQNKLGKTQIKGAGYQGQDAEWTGLDIPVSDIYRAARRVATGWSAHYGFCEAIKVLDQMKSDLLHISATYQPLKFEE